ncbi:MAG: cation-transporting P-type ATPase [Anaerolineales bacterium]
MVSDPIYNLPVSEVFTSLETSPNGLTDSDVEARRSLYGSNQLSEPPREPAWRKLLGFTTHPMALLLWVAGGIALWLREPTLGIIIWVVVLVNAALSYWREYRAEQATAALQHLLPSYARVIRDGAEVKVDASDLVAGDLLVLAEGDNIPADARVVEEYGLRVNNAVLTGEAVPARKTADASLREGISEVERPNLVFAGTSVVSGTGRAVVYATGMLTQFGRIVRLTQAVREEPSRLQQEMSRLTRTISLIALGLGVIVFAVGIVDVNLGINEAFILALGIIVATIPEGLPATVTLSLAVAVQRLAQKGVLVKKLSILETLEHVSVICTDKSGTLTQNQMTVRQVWVSGKPLVVTGTGYEPEGDFVPNPGSEAAERDLHALLTAAMLCNNSRLNPPAPDHPHWTVLGDQTEAALRVVALKGGLVEETLNMTLPRIHEIPFDARRKRMSTIHQVNRKDGLFPEISAGQQVAFVKGAPREVLQLCTHIRMHGEVTPLDDSLRVRILSANDDYARSALRVLALAYHELPQRVGSYSAERVEVNLVFLGLTAMMDPPRPEVAEAVSTCRKAGVRMVMITGDYGLTAESLARRIGMLSTPNPLILTGAELEQLNDIELQGMLEKEVIFARMAPEHKLRLVAAFQAQGEVVAVTGDGVNDAPALRKADVGVAMGLVGTDVAKEAADVILTNDNFSTIARAIEEGRTVYDNLRKFTTYIFSSNVPEILPFILTALLTPQVMPLALGVKQILAIDLGTDLFPALALGSENPEPDVMLRPPRSKSQPLVDGSLLRRAFLWLGLLEAVLCFLAFYFINNWIDIPYFKSLHTMIFSNLPHSDQHNLAITVFYAGVVMAQVGNAFACRTERNRGRFLGWLSNPTLLRGIAIELVILLGLIYIHPLANLFDHIAIPPAIWIGLFFFPLIIYSLDWIRKWLVRWRERFVQKVINSSVVKEET